jgi:hypothetical protein
MALPLAMFREQGLDVRSLAVNVQSGNRSGVGTYSRCLVDPGRRGFGRCQQFGTLVEKLSPPKKERYALRFHFAEPGDAKPGERVFDVADDGKVVLRALDVAKEAGGPQRTLMKEVRGVELGSRIALELVPHAQAVTPKTAPILNGIELIKE